MELGNRFGASSKKELMGVHPHLIILATSALILCHENGVDFTVFDGIRDASEQSALVESGVSWTMNSMHIKQDKTGYGHAVDLVPFIKGKLRFDAIEHLKIIGKNMRISAEHHRVPITWGANVSHGGDWQTRNDMYHYELNQHIYLE